MSQFNTQINDNSIPSPIEENQEQQQPESLKIDSQQYKTEKTSTFLKTFDQSIFIIIQMFQAFGVGVIYIQLIPYNKELCSQKTIKDLEDFFKNDYIKQILTRTLLVADGVTCEPKFFINEHPPTPFSASNPELFTTNVTRSDQISINYNKLMPNYDLKLIFSGIRHQIYSIKKILLNNKLYSFDDFNTTNAAKSAIIRPLSDTIFCLNKKLVSTYAYNLNSAKQMGAYSGGKGRTFNNYTKDSMLSQRFGIYRAQININTSYKLGTGEYNKTAFGKLLCNLIHQNGKKLNYMHILSDTNLFNYITREKTVETKLKLIKFLFNIETS